jgi:hypothetical protein
MEAAKPIGNSATSQPGSASAARICGSPKTRTENQMTRAEPIQRATRPDTTPPSTPPMALSANSTPVKAGRT